jgi:hypothetical protein
VCVGEIRYLQTYVYWYHQQVPIIWLKRSTTRLTKDSKNFPQNANIRSEPKNYVKTQKLSISWQRVQQHPTTTKNLIQINLNYVTLDLLVVFSLPGTRNARKEYRKASKHPTKCSVSGDKFSDISLWRSRHDLAKFPM